MPLACSTSPSSQAGHDAPPPSQVHLRWIIGHPRTATSIGDTVGLALVGISWSAYAKLGLNCARREHAQHRLVASGLLKPKKRIGVLALEPPSKGFPALGGFRGRHHQCCSFAHSVMRLFTLP